MVVDRPATSPTHSQPPNVPEVSAGRFSTSPRSDLPDSGQAQSSSSARLQFAGSSYSAASRSPSPEPASSPKRPRLAESDLAESDLAVWLRGNHLGEYLSRFEDLGVRALRDLVHVDAEMVAACFNPPMKPLDKKRFFDGIGGGQPLQSILKTLLDTKVEEID